MVQNILLHPIPVGLHECHLRLGKQESQLLLEWTDRTAYPKASVRLRVAKIKKFPGDCSRIHAMVMLLYRMLQSTLGYDTVTRRTWVMAAGKNIAFKIVAKPLQTETWLLLTDYSKSPTPYLTAPLPTRYDVSFSHNTHVTNRQTTYRTQGSI